MATTLPASHAGAETLEPTAAVEMVWIILVTVPPLSLMSVARVWSEVSEVCVDYVNQIDSSFSGAEVGLGGEHLIPGRTNYHVDLHSGPTYVHQLTSAVLSFIHSRTAARRSVP